MKHLINPTNDYVVKQVLAQPGREWILVNFINSLIKPEEPILNITVENPHNDRNHERDKMTIADIKATDTDGHIYQIEVQNVSPKYLGDRIAYTANRIYSAQLSKGDSFELLKPIHAIWLLSKNYYPDNAVHHEFQIWDRVNDQPLTKHCNIHVFELEKWAMPKTLQARDFWLYFYKDAQNWRQLPERLLQIPVMRELMSILTDISDNHGNYLAYLGREDARLVEITEESRSRRADAQIKQAQEIRQEAEGITERAKQTIQKAEGMKKRAKQTIHEAEGMKKRAKQTIHEAEGMKKRAEQTFQEAEGMKKRAEQTFQEAEQKTLEAKQSKQEAEQYRQMLLAAGIDPTQTK